MGYYFLIATCSRCGVVFPDIPERVPVIRDAGGEKQPLCRDGVSYLNRLRSQRGLPKWEIPEDAYSFCEE